MGSPVFMDRGNRDFEMTALGIWSYCAILGSHDLNDLTVMFRSPSNCQFLFAKDSGFMGPGTRIQTVSIGAAGFGSREVHVVIVR